MGEKLLRSRGEHGIRQALRFRANHALAEVGQAVVPSPLVIQSGVWTLIRLFYQSRRKHAFQTPIERARTEVKHHSEHDAEAVTFFVGQSQQDVNYRRREREQILWRLSSCR